MTPADRPPECCGLCPPIIGGGYDCTCEGNPRCAEWAAGRAETTTATTEDAARVLYAHEWNQNVDERCACGHEPSGDHVLHQAQALATAGLLATPRTQPRRDHRRACHVPAQRHGRDRPAPVRADRRRRARPPGRRRR